MEARNMRILRAVSLLITVCLFCFPAHAQYGGGTGEPNDPYQLATAEDLILLGDSPEDYDKHFILTADIDLDPNLPGRKVFDKAVIAPDADPVKDYFQGTAFTGVFDGNGHTISHLTIMGTGYLGLFGQLGTGAEVKNVGLVDVNITGSGDYVGGLVGSNGGWYSGGGVLINCYSTGTVTGNDDVGGLVGDNYAGSITSSYSTGVVSSTGRSVGGLVGFNWDASITTSYSTGMVTGNEDASITTSYSTGMVTGNEDVGGLVGLNWFGSITTSYSTGTVNGYSYVGGLVGNNGGSIITSCSTGTVTGNLSVGGLVGWNTSSITSSYSTGMVTGDDYVGGLVGWNYGAISTSYSTGSVSGTGLSVGGLVGFNRRHSRRGSITSSYSTGMVTGNEDVGGLVGSNSGGIINSSYSTGMVSGETGVGGLVGLNWFGSISTSYSTGSVSGNSDVGGLVGYSDYGIIITSFWDIESSGQATSASGTGLTTAEMQDPNTFMDAGWDFVGKPDGPHDIWAESEGGGYPILCWQLPQGFGLPTFSGGTGEADDPYRISTPRELNGIGHNPRLMDAYFELVNYIDLAGIDFYIIGSEFYPFTGSFNGNGHTISHMTIVGNDSLGLFGYLESGAEVKNLGVVDVNVTGSYFCGGLVGFNWDASITTSYSTGMVIGETGVGGLVGVNSGSITTSYSASTVSGETGVGGLVGDNDGSITSSYSTGMVTGDDYVGGLVGFNFIGNSITTCYSTGEVSATGWEVGGLVGDSMSREEVHNSFWDIETSGQTSSAGGTGKTTAEMQTVSTFLDAGWDFVDETANGTDDIWWILEGQDYPRLWWELTGTEADPYIITDVTELQAIQHDLSACYALGNDVDASATKTWNDGAGFDPIGWRIDLNNYEGFTGKFDGRGHIIFDLFINRPFTDYVGLFGLILDGAEVKNVGLVDADITSRRNSGSLVGYSSGATLSDSWSTGIVKGSYDDQMRLGGLIGRSTGENSFVTRCFSNATVIATGGAHQVGGLAGYNGHGSVMSDCYATGDVSGYWKVGGLVGDNIDGSEGTVIQRCYSTGRISSKFGGGLVGFNWRNGITIDSYWDMETSRQISSYGGVGKTTAEMQNESTFTDAGWDFVDETENGTEDIWWILEGRDYPRLWWELIEE